MHTSNSFSLVLVLMVAFADSLQAAEAPANALPAEVLKALTEGQDFAVMSVDPEGVAAVPTSGWKILKHNFVKDPAVRKEVVDAKKKSVEDASDSAACFNPRHAISTVYDKKKYVLVICFECSQVLIYIGGEEKGYKPIGESAAAVLDKVLSGPDTSVESDEK